MIVEFDDKKSYRKNKQKENEEKSKIDYQHNEQKWLMFIENYLLFILSYMKNYHAEGVCEEEREVLELNITTSVSLLKDIHLLRHSTLRRVEQEEQWSFHEARNVICNYLQEISCLLQISTINSNLQTTCLPAIHNLKQYYPMMYRSSSCNTPWVLPIKGVTALHKRRLVK